MKHLVRAAFLIVGLLIIGIAVPRLLQGQSVLANFGFHTPDRVVSNAAWANIPQAYADSSTCAACHTENYNEWQQSGHKTVSCENCHGPAEAHLKGEIVPVVDKSNDLCGTCHYQLDSRPASFPQVASDKFGGLACITCHNPHSPLDGMPPKAPHTLEGRTDCQACHNPTQPLTVIPPVMPHSLDGRSDCLSCHGPETNMDNINTSFLAPQAPHSFEGLEDCLQCHNTGGIKPFPANHAGRTDENCTACHRSA